MAATLTNPRLWPAGVALAAAMLGVLAGVSPQLAIGAAGGLAFVALTVANLTLGVAMFTAVTYLEVLPGLEGLSTAKAAGAVLVLSWMAASTLREGQARPQIFPVHPYLCAAGAAFIAWTALTAVWAPEPGAVAESLTRYIPNLLLLPIVFSAVERERDVLWILAAFVFGTLISTGYGVFISPTDADAAAEGRISGAGADPDYLSASLVASMAVCTAVMATRRFSVAARGICAVALVLLFVSLVMTASRTGMVALLLATAFAVFTAGRGRRLPATIVVSLMLVVGAVYITQAAPAHIRERLQEIDTSGTGRTDIWKVATRVIEAHPIGGIGSGNFVTQSVHYLFEAGHVKRSDLIVDTPKVTHNIYLGFWAELGIVGLVLFLCIAGTVVHCALRAARIFQNLGDRRLELVSRGVAVAMAGQLTASFFVSYQYEKALWLMLSVGPALLALSRRAEREARPA
jgi:O-antigen ligase